MAQVDRGRQLLLVPEVLARVVRVAAGQVHVLAGDHFAVGARLVELLKDMSDERPRPLRPALNLLPLQDRRDEARARTAAYVRDTNVTRRRSPSDHSTARHRGKASKLSLAE
jgi:hypothetical protein